MMEEEVDSEVCLVPTSTGTVGAASAKRSGKKKSMMNYDPSIGIRRVQDNDSHGMEEFDIKDEDEEEPSDCYDYEEDDDTRNHQRANKPRADDGESDHHNNSTNNKSNTECSSSNNKSVVSVKKTLKKNSGTLGSTTMAMEEDS